MLNVATTAVVLLLTGSVLTSFFRWRMSLRDRYRRERS
jgi:hypothetical protein